jgi:hypothetical protein
MSAVFASTLKEGYLLLRKNGILKSWQRRWFVLDDKWLTYYKNHSDVGIKFSKQISREDMLEVVSPDDDRADSALSEFDLSIEMVDGTSCVVRAGSIEERDAWVSALDSLLRAALTPRANISAARRLALSGGNIHSVASDSLRIEDIYEIQEMLGSGVAGEVHRAVHKDTGGVVAIKTISKKKFLGHHFPPPQSAHEASDLYSQSIPELSSACRGQYLLPYRSWGRFLWRADGKCISGDLTAAL